MNTSTARQAFRTNAAQTASPSKAVVMLAERMTADAAQAIVALEEQRFDDAHTLLVHAQDIVDHLFDALDVSLFPSGSNLASLYNYLSFELVEANVFKDADRARNAHRIAGDIAETFRQAAASS